MPTTIESAIYPTILLFLLPFIFIVSSKWQYRWVYGVGLNAFLLLSGMFMAIDLSYDSKLANKHEYKALVRLLDNPQQRSRSYRATAEIIEIIEKQQFRQSHEKVLLYFSLTDSSTEKLRYGDILATTITLQEFEKPLNPYQFDIKSYMRQESIRYSSYIKPEAWILCKNSSNPIIRVSLRMRDNLVSLFKRYKIEGQELAVVSALTIGYRDLLDTEIQKVYATTGAMHILSVSGLHVGILYLLLVFLMRLIPHSRISASLKLSIALFFLWFFALLTGLSPSVCRSSLMFSLLAIGQSCNVRSNPINTLAIAAFALLVANPYNILNIGFQLSFLAVLSIVIFYPKIYMLLCFRNKIADYTWSLIAVSIAAQLGTFPLTTLYFSQFPNYFLLTNLIAIPLSTLILYVSVLLLLTAPLPFIATWVAKLLDGLLVMLNGGLGWIDSLPFSLTSGIHINSLQALLLCASLWVLTMILYTNRFIHTITFLLLIAMVFTLSTPHYIDVSKNELVIFNVPRKSAICVRTNGVAHFIQADSSYQNLVNENGFFLSGYINHLTQDGNYRYISSSNDNSPFNLTKRNGITMLSLKDKIIAIPHGDSASNLRTNNPLKIDVLVVNNFFSDKLLKIIKPKQVVIDGSVPKWKIDRYLLLFMEQHVDVYNTNSAGAYRLKLQ